MRRQPSVEERLDAITKAGLLLAAEVQNISAGPKDAIAILACVMARILTEFPEEDWPGVFVEFEKLTRSLYPAVAAVMRVVDHG